MSQPPRKTSAPLPALEAPVFPCTRFPAVPRHARLLGIYPQRQIGRFMQRVGVPGGILSADQWRTLAQIVRRFTPQTPLHLTTRQDIEFHDLCEQDVPLVEQLLQQAGLSSFGSGGDTLRNITVCPCAAGGTGDVPNLLPLAHAIGQTLMAFEGILALPRKFKISLGCRRGCGRPFTHDLAFVAIMRDGKWGLRALAAGSLGPMPAAGIVVFDWIEPADAVPLSLAVVRLFGQHGDRQNRAKARLRHVRERLGNEAFLAELRQQYQAARAERCWPNVDSVTASNRTAMCVLDFPNGDLMPDDAEALAAVAEADHAAVRIGNDHRIFISTLDDHAADALLQRAPALRKRAAGALHVIACPGTRWCSRAIADTNHLTNRLRAAVVLRPGSGLQIAVSGCPNGCAGSYAADVGIIGRRASGGQSTEQYSVYLGGHRGATDVLAKLAADSLSADLVIRTVAELAQH